jgi:IS30 family transposase
MNTSLIQKESEQLIAIVNTEFNLDILKKCRQRPYVDARRVYTQVMRDRGYSLTAIGRSLGKDHATILHYLKNSQVLFGQHPNLDESYKRISKLRNNTVDPIDEMDKLELRHHIYRLRQNLESLSLRLTKTEDRLDNRDRNEERLSDIFYVIRKRLPVGKEKELKSKLITIINGL